MTDRETDPSAGQSATVAPAELPRHVLDNLLEGCQVVGQDFRYLYLNDAAAEHGRRPKHELVGQTMMAVYPGIEHTAMFSALRACLQDRQPKRMVNEFTFPDGSQGWFELRIEPVPEGVVVLSIDITERRRAELRIAQLDAMLRGIRNVNQLITREADPQRLITRASELLVESRGFTSCCIVLTTAGVVTLTADAGREAKLATIRRMLARGELPECLRQATVERRTVLRARAAESCRDCPVNADYSADRDAAAIPLTSPGKCYGAMLVSLPPGAADHSEEVELLREVAADLALALESIERQAAADQARAERDSLARFPEENPSPVLRVAHDGTILYANPGSAVVLKHWACSVGQKLPGLAMESVRDAAAAGTRRELQADIDGAHYWLTFAPVSGQTYVNIYGIDVTEQRHTEEQLRSAQRLESVGRLAGGVAHDFNNLLAVILNFAGFAMDAVPQGDPVREDLEEILKAARSAATLTRQLLAFSRRQVLRPERLSLNHTIQAMESMLRRLLSEDIELVMDLADDVGPVIADRGQMEQVVMNLLVNARDAMPKGGKLTIATSNLGMGTAAGEPATLGPPHGYAVLSVTDTGVGMDAQVKARIFEPFFTTKGFGQGTGLGLATVHGVVEQSGGSMRVASVPGQGTTFEIYLPAAPPGEEQPRAPAVTGRPPGHETVLVVEDEEGVRNVAKRALSAAGYRVLVAAHGPEALLVGARHEGSIALLLTDVVMPGMSGRELADRLGALRPGLRVLYMSGYTDNAIAHHGVLDPGVELLEKPFSVGGLLRKVRELLDAEPPRRPPEESRPEGDA